MPGVLLVQAGDPNGAPGGLLLAHVGTGDQFVAVGIGVHGQHDDVVENAQGFGVAAGAELVDELQELLGAEHFCGVQAAVDPHDGAPFGGQAAGLVLGEVFRKGEPAGDLAVAAEAAVVVGRGQDGHPLGPALRGPADIDQFHPAGLGGQLFPVGGELRIVRQHIVVAQVETELLAGSRDPAGGWGGQGGRQERNGHAERQRGQRAGHG